MPVAQMEDGTITATGARYPHDGEGSLIWAYVDVPMHVPAPTK